jgi:SAM-dependent methyltransferase
MNLDVRRYNRGAWDAEVERGNPWTVPVSPEIIRRAREGDWEVVLTPLKAVPRDWFPPLAGLSVLGLAASGGQQAPILAAAGARVTVLDNSLSQLAQDRAVAERDGLELTLVEGDMADLHGFASESFDLVFHPCSNCFVPDVGLGGAKWCCPCSGIHALARCQGSNSTQPSFSFIASRANPKMSTKLSSARASTPYW